MARRTATRLGVALLLLSSALALLAIEPILLGWIALLGVTFGLGCLAGSAWTRSAAAQQLHREVQDYLRGPDEPGGGVGVR